jgi:tetratricopeptide (TPR) repeat protein
MANMSQDEFETQSQLNATIKCMMALYKQGRYEEALNICLKILRTHPGLANVWYAAAVNCTKLERWEDAIRYAQTTLSNGGNDLGIYEVLVCAHAALGQMDKSCDYGLQAFNIRVHRFNDTPIIAWPFEPIPPLPSDKTREHNIIAFSLFGHDSKYCETAVLNVQDQPSVYPYWVCRFYVDSSVPESVINRLRQGGAQIVQVDGSAAQWPGEMWRLLALNDPQAHRILFRDADSLISQREARVVEQWLTSGKRFHMMRDHVSHMELIMAGLWGVVVGSLPPLDKLMECFAKPSNEDRHFADQFFLRQCVWPYARTSLMQHDSIFGFMNAVPFPDGEKADGFQVGTMNSIVYSMQTALPNGSEITWALYRFSNQENTKILGELVCTYTNTVQNGIVKAYIPKRYAQWIEQGTACIRTIENR